MLHAQIQLPEEVGVAGIHSDQLKLVLDCLMLSWKSCSWDIKYKESERKGRQKLFSFYLTERKIVFQRLQTGVCVQPEKPPLSKLLFGTIFYCMPVLNCFAKVIWGGISNFLWSDFHNSVMKALFGCQQQDDVKLFCGGYRLTQWCF